VGPHGFTVDLHALGAVRDKVGRLADHLTGPPRDVPDAEAFGHARMTKAVDEFATRETRSMAQLAGEAVSIRRRLGETIKTYRQADDNAAGRFGEIAS
jgi:hypothetical protein